MQIKVKLFATLRINREKEQLQILPENADIKTAVKLLGIAEEDAAIIFLNGIRVTLEHHLKENDTLSIFPPIGGG